MAKFSTRPAPPNVSGGLTTEPFPTLRTEQGGVGFQSDAKSELFKLAVANFVREDTFYESGDVRDERFDRLVHTVTIEDPQWMRRFIPWLRSEANMRSASLVAAAEYVKAGGKGGRGVVSAVLMRADEPAEMLAYWHQRHGRRLPMPIKRGVADAVTRLYTERNALKYDGQAKAWRFADVIELVHPKPIAEWQSALFKYLLNKRHGRLPAIPAILNTLAQDSVLMSLEKDERRNRLSVVTKIGWSWERLSGWLPGGMDAEAWETVIPTMGYMALLRNLRNFDDAGISDSVVQSVVAKLTDPEEVAKSRQFPFRFWAAYKNTASLRWAAALETALGLSLSNVPALAGRTLILVDRSPSMFPGYFFSTKTKSDIPLAEKAALFGSALAVRAEKATLVQYGNGSAEVPFTPRGSVLRLVENSFGMIEGTNTPAAVAQHYADHDRIVIITDEQSMGNLNAQLPKGIPAYTWNLSGNAVAHARSGDRGQYTFAGLTDQSFRVIPLLEKYEDQEWPF